MSNPTMNPYEPQPNKASRRFFAWIRSSGLMRGDDRWIGGVCSGLASRLGWSPTLVRALMIVATLFFGFGAALYALGWFLLPDVRGGHILGEDLIAGQWNWNCLGCFLFMAVAVLIPGAGWACIALAAVTLWALAKSGIRQQEGYGFGVCGMRGRPPAAGPAGPYAGPQGPYAGPMSPGYGPAGPTNTSNPAASYGPYTGLASPYAGPAPASPNVAGPGPMGAPMPAGTPYAGSSAASMPYAGQSMPPTAQHPGPGVMPGGPTAAAQTARPAYASPFAPGQATAPTSPAPANSRYDTSEPETTPVKSLRRRPAGPIMVLAVLGLMFISFAGVMAAIQANDFGLGPIIELVTIWSAAVCIVMGVIVVVLGVRGRRTGGLIPLGLMAGACAVTMIVVSGTYSSYYYDLTHDTGTYVSTVDLGEGVNSENAYGMNEVQAAHMLVADSSDRTFKTLKGGVLFMGDSFENSHAILDLSAWEDTHPDHELELQNGRKTISYCPAGTITLSAYRSQVHIILPDGCSYAFGSSRDGYQIAEAIGGKYDATSTSYSIMSMTPTALTSAPLTYGSGMSGSEYDWLNNYESTPVNGPELLIDVPYALEARVNVTYVSNWEGFTFSQYENLHSTEAGREERQ
ncbi:PspC domain-containing protein [Bifidobacterium miconisargentati]|uniref:PspC domain-containing protein n=1 Tax=Bifidobacterium miconisargentati TaxID=2834437 RepID=UPI001BDC5A4E|nr:PspC domain-containing protein [Bifidobacterium miconisargentati]MBW3089582.1 PspC domain-containing protein [Bifidobacterium miconisargentati]